MVYAIADGQGPASHHHDMRTFCPPHGLAVSVRTRSLVQLLGLPPGTLAHDITRNDPPPGVL